jgi:hypothetical protein
MEAILNRLQIRALIVGSIGTAITVSGVVWAGEQAWQSYLFAYLLVMGMGLGSLALLMIHHMTGGAWGFVTQRIMEAGARTIWVIGLLFLPIFLFGLGSLYPWVNPAGHEFEEIIGNKALYLNPIFWRVRTVIYFVVWLALAFAMSRWSRRLDVTGDVNFVVKMRRWSAPGIILFGLCLTFAATDWGMSLEPAWFSTIYAPQFFVGMVLAVLAFSILVLSKAKDYEPLSEKMSVEYFHHLGNLTLAFTVLWAYISFSQYLIIWSGNLPEEIPWYLNRQSPGLIRVSLVLIIFHFAVPFFLLLARRHKRTISKLKQIAVFILLMRVVDIFWIIDPAFSPKEFTPHMLDATALLGLGGIWLGTFAWNYKQVPILPAQDPRMDEALVYHDEVSEHA